jgi:hypothetical protein
MQSTDHLSQQCSNTLIRIGFLSVTLHILILLSTFFYSYNFISCVMLEYEWFSGTVSMLLLIEHTVWLHLVWSVSIHNSHSHNTMLISFVGVLLLTTAWIMELVVPIEPDISKHHVIYAVLFVKGCMINIFSSLALIPGRMGSGVVLYKHIAYTLSIFSVIVSLVWFVVWYLREILSFDIDWHVGVWLEYIAYTCYLSSLGVIFFQFSATQSTSRVMFHHISELDECVHLTNEFHDLTNPIQ